MLWLFRFSRFFRFCSMSSSGNSISTLNLHVNDDSNKKYSLLKQEFFAFTLFWPFFFCRLIMDGSKVHDLTRLKDQVHFLASGM